MLKICEYCKKEYSANTTTQKYCSIDCYLDVTLKQGQKITPKPTKIIPKIKSVKTENSVKIKDDAKTEDSVNAKNKALHKKICEHCGEEFETNRRKRRYCGYDCYHKYTRKDEEAKVIKNCKYCEKAFLSKYKTQKYCGYGCYHKYMKKDRGSKGIKVCEYCKKEYNANSSKQKYCDAICYQKSRNKYKYALGLNLTKECICCGKEFEILQHNKLCCSKECGVNLKKNRWKEQYVPVEKTLYDRICKYCGKKFKTYNINNICYCSKACNSSYSKLKRKKIIQTLAVDFIYVRNCIFCNKVFETRFSIKKYCTHKCCMQHASEKKTKQRKEELAKIRRVCKNCGKEFAVKEPKTIHCNPKCRMQYKIKNRRKVVNQ